MAYEYLSALKYLRPASHHWRPEVKLCSALEGDGVGQVWEVMAEFRQKMEECGELEGRRSGLKGDAREEMRGARRVSAHIFLFS